MRLVVVGEDLGIAAEIDDGAQRLLGGARRHLVLQLVGEAAPGGAVLGPLVEDAADMGGERDMIQQMPGEQPLALVGIEAGELPPLRRQLDVAAADFGEAQHLQRLGDREEVVDLHVHRRRDDRKIGLAIIGLDRNGLDDLMFWIIIGIILGGRLGYILFYMVPYQMDVLAADPLAILRIWDGGMAFHGGILGVAVVLWWFAAKRGVNLLSVGDIAGVTAPIGIGLVRIANFTNAELYGRPTESSIGMVFPEGYVPGSTPPAYNWETGDWIYRGDELARHPSQLYESVLEGWLPLLVLSVLIWRFGALKRPGLVAGLFLLMYGIGRSIAENFREPDAFVDGLPEWLTMGIILSAPMWIGGAWLVWNALKHRKI